MALIPAEDLPEFLQDETVTRLKAHVGTAALFGARVVKTGEAIPAGDAPYVIVRQGKSHGVPAVSGASLGQKDVKVEIWATNREIMPTLTAAVQAAMNGWVQPATGSGDGPIRGSVLTDTSRTNEEDGKWKRTDTFALFYDPLWDDAVE
jgi:hypothetical protein